METRLTLLFGDLSTMKADAIVCSTDETMLAGGPVHRAVHAAAGPALAAEVQRIGHCAIGGARLTQGHKLRARYVIHTVAPNWEDGKSGEMEALTSCYRNALAIATARGLKSVALPSIGAGTQPQFPLAKAAPIAIRTLLQYLHSHPLPERVILVCNDATVYRAHLQALREQAPT